jgi:hypothetical protein
MVSSATTSTGSTNCYLGDYGSTGWAGQNSPVNLTINTSTNELTGGYFQIRLNEYYLDSYSYAQQLSCVSHEVGHSLMLGDVNYSSNRVMWHQVSTLYTPTSGDIATLDQRY